MMYVTIQTLSDEYATERCVQEDHYENAKLVARYYIRDEATVAYVAEFGSHDRGRGPRIVTVATDGPPKQYSGRPEPPIQPGQNLETAG